MEPSTRPWGILALTTLLGLVMADPSIPISYCASVNTASGSANTSIYQSEGLCYGLCNNDNYAFAVLQDNSCWCSNYAPSSSIQTTTSSCDTPCPGFPDDLCGGSGLFGYLALSASPSGTTGGDTTATVTTSSSVTTRATETAVETQTSVEMQTSVETQTNIETDKETKTIVTKIETTVQDTTTASVTSSTEETSSITKSSSKTSSYSSTAETTSTTITPVPSVKTVTEGGIVSLVTTYVTPTANAGSSRSGDGGLNAGAIAGIVIGILILLVAMAIGGYLLYRHKKQQEAAAAGHGRQGSFSNMMQHTPTSSGGFSGGLRRSTLMPMDPRLDPVQLYAHENASQQSIGSICDYQDYSRKVSQPRTLAIMNPDPVVESSEGGHANKN